MIVWGDQDTCFEPYFEPHPSNTVSDAMEDGAMVRTRQRGLRHVGTCNQQLEQKKYTCLIRVSVCLSYLYVRRSAPVCTGSSSHSHQLSRLTAGHLDSTRLLQELASAVTMPTGTPVTSLACRGSQLGVNIRGSG